MATDSQAFRRSIRFRLGNDSVSVNSFFLLVPQQVQQQGKTNIDDNGNYTKVSNVIFDELMADLSPAEFKVLMRMIRLSWGFHRDHCQVGLKSICKSCGLTTKTVIKAIESLAEKNIIVVVAKGDFVTPSTYRISTTAAGTTGKFPVPKVEGTGVVPVVPTGEIPLPLLAIFPLPTGEIPVIKQSIKINTTNKQSEGDSIPDLLKKLGFTKAHLTTLNSQQKLSEQEIHQSLDAFAFDLRVNNKTRKIKGPPLNYIMAILRKGNQYLPPANYQSPEVRQQEELFKARDEQMKKQRQIDQQNAEVEFQQWLGGLSKEATLSMIPPLIRKSPESIHLAVLKGEFLKVREAKFDHSKP